MPAQGELRDRCHVIEGWCASHQLPAGHGMVEGEIGMDPADRMTTADAEEQYAGTLPAASARSAHERRASMAVAEKDSDELARLRAESAAVGALRNASQVFLVRGRCLLCDEPVIRRIQEDGPYATVAPWEHELTGKDSQHPVTNVLPPSSTV